MVGYSVEHGVLPTRRVSSSAGRKTVHGCRDRWREGGCAASSAVSQASEARISDELMKLLEHARRELSQGASLRESSCVGVHQRDLTAHCAPQAAAPLCEV